MTTKKQHYVFQSYLSGFSISNEETDKFLWVYDKSIPKVQVPKHPKSTSSICYDIFYYGQTTEGDDIMEQKFSSLENTVSPLFKAIDIKDNSVINVAESDLPVIAFTIALSITRVPSFRSGIEEFLKKVVETTANNNYAKMLGPSGEPFEEFIHKHGPLKAQISPWISLEPMIKVAEQITESMLQKKWQFHKAPKNISFITGDNPGFWSYSSQMHKKNSFVGPAHPLSEIIFPIRKDIALVCTPVGPNMIGITADTQTVKKFNKGIAMAAKKYVVADIKSDALARLVYKNRTLEQKISVD